MLLQIKNVNDLSARIQLGREICVVEQLVVSAVRHPGAVAVITLSSSYGAFPSPNVARVTPKSPLDPTF